MRMRCGGLLTLVVWAVVATPGRAEAQHHAGNTTTPAGTAARLEDAAAKAKVAKPTFSPAPGSHPAPLSVTIATATAGATLRFTTDGTKPSRKSPLYTGPLTFAAKTTLKAAAFKSGLAASAIATGVYTVATAPPEEGGTLFVAALTPQSGAATSGAGSATLTLTADRSAAYLRFAATGLTGPVTSQHIHAGDGTVLFDVDDAPALADGARLWHIAPAGTFDAAAILATLEGGDAYLNLHTALYPAGEIKGFFRRAAGSQTFTPPPAPPALPPGPPTAEDAARLLLQGTYGPQWAEIARVQGRGAAAWVDEQLAMPPSTPSHLATFDTLSIGGDPLRPDPRLPIESLVARGITGADALRQRIVLALSELFVVSIADADVRNHPDGTAAYVDLLAQHAFGNYRELLEAVTLAPTMGVYLDMAGSSRSLPELGRNPNENYAREVLQLFSIGLYELHPDGTLRLDAANQPIPTYDQEIVEAFARAFTGWTFGGQNQGDPRRFFRPTRNFRRPMEPWEAYHDTGEKRLLGGVVLPAGQSARADLESALDAIFHHPNVGPFVCRALIQRLVTSNPDRGHVFRCVQAFENNGAGVRGDLAAMVRTILLDYAARSATLVARQDQGHLREPVVRVMGLLRTLGATTRDGRWRFLAGLERSGLATGQTPLRSPTVFNFFEPTYALPGEIAAAGLVSPEFQITTETTIVGAANTITAILEAAGTNRPVRIDVAALLPPQAPTDTALLDRIDLLLFGGSMSDVTRGVLSAALADAGFPRTGERRVLELLRLAAIAPDSAVQR